MDMDIGAHRLNAMVSQIMGNDRSLSKKDLTSPQGVLEHILNFFTFGGVRSSLENQYDELKENIMIALEKAVPDRTCWTPPDVLSIELTHVTVKFRMPVHDEENIDVEVSKEGISVTSKVERKTFTNVSTLLLLQARYPDINIPCRLTDEGEINLTGVDLSAVKLEGINLNGAKMQDVRLEGAELTSVSFYKADMSCCDLYQAKLRNVDLRKADLAYADLRCNDWQDVIWEGMPPARAKIKDDAQPRLPLSVTLSLLECALGSFIKKGMNVETEIFFNMAYKAVMSAFFPAIGCDEKYISSPVKYFPLNDLPAQNLTVNTAREPAVTGIESDKRLAKRNAYKPLTVSNDSGQNERRLLHRMTSLNAFLRMPLKRDSGYVSVYNNDLKS